MPNDHRVDIKFNRFPELQQKFPREVGQRIRGLALEGERIAKVSMQQSPAGENGHSLPGNPPRIDTSALINSIGVHRVEPFVQAITTQVDYAASLEYGTSRMAARPFFGPMAVEIEGMIPNQFAGLLEMLI